MENNSGSHCKNDCCPMKDPICLATSVLRMCESYPCCPPPTIFITMNIINAHHDSCCDSEDNTRASINLKAVLNNAQAATSISRTVIEWIISNVRDAVEGRVY